MTPKVLVTGGAGFIGSHVADAYLAAGNDVTVLDDLSTGQRGHVPAGATVVQGGGRPPPAAGPPGRGGRVPGGAPFVQADVRSPAARELLARGGFTLLNHHAAQMDVR